MVQVRIRERVGWALVVERPWASACCAGPDPREIVRWFVDTTCRTGVAGSCGRLRWALLTPSERVGLTGWSAYEGEADCCVLEGTFFDDYDGLSCLTAGSEAVAARFLADFGRSPEATVSKLNGVFSGFCYEQSSGRLSFFVDRTGVCSTYHHLTPGRLAVFTDMGGARSLVDCGAAFDPQSVYENMTIGIVLEDRTLLKDTFVAPPGMIATFDGTRVSYRRYWSWPKRRRNGSIRESAARISSAIDRHFLRVAGHLWPPVGIALSGGRDSRLVFAALLRSGVSFEALTYILEKQDTNLAAAAALCERKRVPLHTVDFRGNARESLTAMADGAAVGLGESAGRAGSA